MPPLPKRQHSKAEKVAHVKSKGQTRYHTCHWPGCGKQCPPAKWVCHSCWLKLPKFLRDKIWDAYRVGQEITLTPSREYLKVAREVQEWIRANYPETAEMKVVTCTACGGTGKNSRGGDCVPCAKHEGKQ